MMKTSNGGKASAEKILASEEINLSKRVATASVTIRYPSWKVNHPSKVI